jgi:hypothetical protein
MQTRQYPRTSVQAFPKTTEYACAVERSSRGRDAWLDPVCWIGSIFLFALAFSAPYWWRLL